MVRKNGIYTPFSSLKGKGDINVKNSKDSCIAITFHLPISTTMLAKYSSFPLEVSRRVNSNVAPWTASKEL